MMTSHAGLLESLKTHTHVSSPDVPSTQHMLGNSAPPRQPSRKPHQQKYWSGGVLGQSSQLKPSKGCQSASLLSPAI